MSYWFARLRRCLGRSDRSVVWDGTGNVVLACRGNCECHHCCIPYEGEDGPHCDDCEPEVEGEPVMKHGDTWECWCDESPHFYETDDPGEALRNLGHMLLKELHIPELAEWLNNKIKGSR